MSNKRQVELIIAAKDQTGKAFDRVNDNMTALEKHSQQIKSIDKLVNDLGKVSTESDEASQSLTKLAKDISAVSDNKINMDSFIELKRESIKITSSLEKAKNKTKQLAVEIKNTESPSRKLTNAFEKQKKVVKALAAEQLKNKSALNSSRAALKSAGLNTKKFGTESRRLNKELDKLTDKAKKATSAVKAESSAAKKAARNHKEMATSIDASSSAIKKIGVAGAAYFATDRVIGYAKELGRISDEWKNIEGRLKLVTNSSDELKEVQNSLFNISQKTSTSYQVTAGLYAQVARNSKELGLSNKEMLALTETINKSTQISGASAQASEAAITQLNQALASGVLRGDEFNSISEQTPRLSQAIADGLGVTIGALRSLAENGELTAERVTKSLLDQKEAIEKEYSELSDTVGRSFTRLTTEFEKFVVSADKVSGTTDRFSEKLNDVAVYINFVSGLIDKSSGLFDGLAVSMSDIYDAATLSLNPIQLYLELLNEETKNATKSTIEHAEGIKEVSKATDELTESEYALQFAQEKENEILQSKQEAVDAVLTKMEEESRLLQMTTKEQFIYNQVKKAGVDLTWEQTDAITAAAEALFNEKNATSKLFEDALSNLEEEQTLLKLSAKEQFVYNQIKNAGTSITAEQTVEIKRAAEALFNEKEAVKAARTETKKLSKATSDYKKSSENISKGSGSASIFGGAAKDAEEATEKTEKATKAKKEWFAVHSQGGKNTSDAFNTPKKSGVILTDTDVLAEAQRAHRAAQDYLNQNPLRMSVSMHETGQVNVNSSFSKQEGLNPGLSAVSISRQALKEGRKS